MRKKKWMLAAILICGATTVLNSCKDKDDDPAPVNPEDSKVTDYSQKSSWHQIPEIPHSLHIRQQWRYVLVQDFWV